MGVRLTNTSTKLIVGLGNPGREYANSLHNLGFMCLNYFAREHHIQFNKKHAQSRTGSGEVAGSEVILARPQTYMNRSGEAVSGLVRKFHVNLSDLLVIHDDMDLPLGRIRIRPSGSSGGHKGIVSIIATLGSQDFARIRVGIGRPNHEEAADTDIIGFLLSNLPPEVKQALPGILSLVNEAIECFLTEGVIATMNKYNQAGKKDELSD